MEVPYMITGLYTHIILPVRGKRFQHLTIVQDINLLFCRRDQAFTLVDRIPYDQEDAADHRDGKAPDVLESGLYIS